MCIPCVLQRKYPGEWDVPPNAAVPAPTSDSKEQWDQLLDCVALQVRQETAAPPPPARTEGASAEQRSSSSSASASNSGAGIGSGSGTGSLAGDVHASLVSVSRAQYERELSALQVEQSQLQATLARALDGGTCDARSRAAVVERAQQLQRSTYNRLRDVMSANLSLHEVHAYCGRQSPRNERRTSSFSLARDSFC